MSHLGLLVALRWSFSGTVFLKVRLNSKNYHCKRYINNFGKVFHEEVCMLNTCTTEMMAVLRSTFVFGRRGKNAQGTVKHSKKHCLFCFWYFFVFNESSVELCEQYSTTPLIFKGALILGLC